MQCESVDFFVMKTTLFQSEKNGAKPIATSQSYIDALLKKKKIVLNEKVMNEKI